MKSIRDDVFALYQQYRFAPLSDDVQEPEDHISHELRFLAYLLESGKDDAIEGFLTDHARRWMPLFAQEVYDQADTELYKAIGKLMLCDVG